MKKITRYILMLFVLQTACHAKNLLWEINLTNYVSGAIGSPNIRMYSDDSVALIINEMTDRYILAFYSDGSPKLIDQLDSEYSFGTYSQGDFCDHSANPNFIAVNIFTNFSSTSMMRTYEFNGTSCVTNTFEANSASVKTSAGINPYSWYTVEGTMLRKYQLNAPSTLLGGVVESGIDGSNYVVSWDSSLGVEYQIQQSSDMTNWVASGHSIIGTGERITWANSLTNSKSFYRITPK